MIKFFRPIRQRMIKENPSSAEASAGKRASKYMFYAIGEIVLVVIGILIALQLNTWKAEANERKIEQLHLQNIKDDLQFQLEIIEQQIKHDSILTLRADSAFSYFDGEITLTQLEKLLYGAFSLGSRKTFVESESSYNELLNTGGMALIRDISLRKGLMRFYQQLHYTSKVVNANNGIIDAMFNLHSTNNSTMFSLDEYGQLDTTNTLTGQERYRLKQSIIARRDLCGIALLSCEKQRVSTLALISEVDENINQ